MLERIISGLEKVLPRGAKEAIAHAAMSLDRYRRPARSFVFNGKNYEYFYHTYNLAWRNERTVEIPIILDMLRRAGDGPVLEVGNVLSHYIPVSHDVIDRYEKAPNIMNEDAEIFRPTKSFDLIISLSTLEHIGWDERPCDPEKVIRAVMNLAGMLAPHGELVATIPLGYNPEIDRYLETGSLTFTGLRALRKKSKRNEWVEVAPDEVFGAYYDAKLSWATALVIGYLEKSGSGADNG